MKRFIAACLVCVCAAAIVGAQAPMPKYGVTVTPEKNVDFTKFKTYSWTKGQPSAVKEIDTAIIGAVDHELNALGMTKSTSGPGDVLVTYYSLTRTDVNLKAKPDAQGIYPEYSVGTLVVALLDTDSRKRLLRLRVDKPIEIERAKLDEAIKTAAADMFAKYPTRQKK
jgi:hypothetical protein